MSRILPISAVAFVWLSVFVSGSLAIRAVEQDEGTKAPQFPQSPTVWINSAPMTIE